MTPLQIEHCPPLAGIPLGEESVTAEEGGYFPSPTRE
jgi:hypothetical protein